MHPTQNNDNSGTSLGQADSTEQQAAQSQTDSTNAQHQDSQTDKVESQDSDMQTKDPDTQSSAMQTQAKDESQAEQQTEKVVLADGESQTFHAVRIIQPTEDAESQAGVYSDVHCDAQTTMSYSNMVEGLSQTELEQASIDVQTEALVTVDQYIQIQPEQAEVICQTVKDEAEAGCQVEPEATESIIQTDFSLANLVDGSAQAVVDVAYQECQATVESSSNEAQTDMSMALQADSEAQATVDVSEQIIQTDVKEIVDTHAQTELETGEQFCQTEVLVDSKDSQTEYVVVEVETQTEIEEALPIITNDPTEVVVQETSQVTVESSQVSSIDEIPDIASSGISNSQNSILDANNPHVMQIVPEVSEEGCQTDPVTIIIGDASFLVKKLKGSSLSPTKVSSMGNEIEIELRADDEEATPYDLPEKENAVAPLPTPPTRIRGNSNPYRARGPRTRGGAVFQRGAIRANQAQYVHRSQVGYQGNPGGAQYYASSAGVLGKYSCPVCSETFHESPALYEHLQHQHAEAFSLIKKPKGREGKTIQCKVSPEPEPPVLMPMEPISKKDTALQLQQQQLQQQQLQQQLQQQQQQQQQHIQHVVLQPQQTVEHVEVVQSTSQPQIVIQQHQETVIQEPVPQEEDDSQTGELFEDPSAWQSPNKTRKRTLARRQITDEEAVVEEAPGEEIHIVIQPSEETITEPAVEEQDQVGVVVGKRKLIVDHSSGEPVVKRIKIDEPPMITEVEPEPEPEEEETPRRRSRASLRAVKAAAEAATPAPEEVKSPRTRGRPKTVKK